MYLNLVLDYIISAVDIALVLFFVSRFIPTIKANKVMIIAFIVLQTIINNVSGIYFEQGSLLRIFISLLITGLFYKLIFEEKLFDIYAYLLLSMIVVFLTETIAILIILAFGLMPQDIHTNPVAMVAAAGLSKGLFFLAIIYFVPKLKLFKRLNKMTVYQIILVCMFNIIIIFMSYWFYTNTQSDYFKDKSIQYIIATTFGAVLFSIGIIGITRGIITQSQKEAEWTIKETEYKRQVFYVSNIQEMMKSIKAQRHDFNNHINCLYGLMKLDNYKEAQEYIEKLSEETIDFNHMLDVGNPVLTALLNTKATAAISDKIHMEKEIKLPENLGIESIDLSIIVGNLLDNALEACRAEDVANKYIKLSMNVKNNNLIIKVCNSKSMNVSVDTANIESGFTSKQDRDNHGFGLSNIKYAVNKYGGIVKFDDKGQEFLANIAIPTRV